MGKKAAGGGKIRIKQIGSLIGCTDKQRASVRGLGLRRMHQVVERQDTPAVRGMVKATVDALTRLKQPERVARLRGKQISDIMTEGRHRRSTMEQRPKAPREGAAEGVAEPAASAAAAPAPAETAPASAPDTPPATVPEG